MAHNLPSAQKILFYGLALKKSNIFIFPIVKIATNCVKMMFEGRLEAGFQQNLLVEILGNLHNNVVKHQ